MTTAPTCRSLPLLLLLLSPGCISSSFAPIEWPEVADHHRLRAAKADSDVDGRLDAAEFASRWTIDPAWRPALVERLRAILPREFVRVDADGDGFLSFEEQLAEPIESFVYIDRNRDGAVTARELRAVRLPWRSGCSPGQLGPRVPQPRSERGVVY